ncbi:MAG: DUF5103 domain-containing protein [Draconibacterium sp.]
MKKFSLLSFFFTLSVFYCLAQQDNYYYQNSVYNENIKTVLMYREGFELSNPIYYMNEDIRLIFKFDDFSEDTKNYYYTVIHCDANWNESFLIQADYINGYPENPLNDYKYSFNTAFNYTNYQLEIPNDNLKLNISGNYVLVVYEDNDKEKVVITQRFYVVEPKVQVDGRVHRATLDAFQGSNQEVDFVITYGNDIIVENPLKDVKVVIMQNNRWDNSIKNLKPLQIRQNRLEYDYDRENVFPGGNEFRYFDNRTNRFNGEYILSTDFHDPYYHKTLIPDEVRANKNYFQYKEMNGKFVVESQDPEVRDFDTECDYTFVHFTLPLESPLLGGSVNVFGALTGWNANKSNEMTWNFDTSAYELTLLLKQGYYNYMYVYVPNGSTVADNMNIEGSFWETENDYQILVYFRDFSGRYDRLVAYRLMNSKEN